MLKLRVFTILAPLLTGLLCGEVQAEGALSTTPATLERVHSPELVQKPALTLQDISKVIGMTYFTYFYGPGLHPENRTFYPNQLGLPDDDGIYLQSQVSVRYKFSSRLALDFQSRFKVILNNSQQRSTFSPYRWEAPRVGISGKLLEGEDWDLTGSINTDFPGTFPQPFSGNQAKFREALFSPGMFSSLKYEPRTSKWSFFGVVSPRYFFYSNPNAIEPQYLKAGYIAQNKPELLLSVQPTLNYQI